MSTRSLDIVVCVHNSLEDVKLCLESVARNLGPNCRIVVVDDGSEEPTEQYCADFAGRTPETLLIRRPEGSGFTKAANAGLAASRADYVILLNSDTIVPAGWTDKMLRCGETAEDIGIVGPLSNAASWQSIPEMNDKTRGGLAVNAFPNGITTVDQMDRLCEDWAREYSCPITALVNGFCFAIKRSVLDTIGHLDQEHFPMGYGEENDFCLRAGNAGFVVAIATDLYVYHAKSKSYSSERRKVLAAQGSKTLNQLHGEVRIRRAVKSMQLNPILVGIREKARQYYQSAEADRGRGGHPSASDQDPRRAPETRAGNVALQSK